MGNLLFPAFTEPAARGCTKARKKESVGAGATGGGRACRGGMENDNDTIVAFFGSERRARRALAARPR
jgi:hypothetical protein